MKDKQIQVWLLAICVVGVALVLWLDSQRLPFWGYTGGDVTRMLTNLGLAALFLERALEILITPWREEAAQKARQDIKTAEADQTQAVSTGNPAAKTAAEQVISGMKIALVTHQAETQRRAYLVAFGLGLAISIAGFRCLLPLTEASAFGGLPAGQRYFFTVVDVLLTAAIIAGGSAFVHSIMSTATTFFEITKAKVKGEA